MKIKVKQASYDEMLLKTPKKERKPLRPNIFFRTLLKLVSLPDLIATRFHCNKIGMEKLGRRENALFLMNHSSFIDLEIAASVLYPRRFNPPPLQHRLHHRRICRQALADASAGLHPHAKVRV